MKLLLVEDETDFANSVIDYSNNSIKLELDKKSVSEINKTYLELGRIAATQHAHLHNVTVKQNALNELQDELTKEYGTNDIDINTGVINHVESV